MRNHRDIKLVTTEEKRIKLVSKQNHNKTKAVFRKFACDRNEKGKSKIDTEIHR